ncbi:eukaryotic translation initiation factor 2B [Boletus edulis BED1]|uniref:Methylthioribose-1-phosphate isomerase n=1 Tax=Boletus edulis BED1 TaxID=1328754 RepID=A0AAD4G705_BOLED|nr:eukaryotic translation initiation factor 2B [Boletus edulis BED1]
MDALKSIRTLDQDKIDIVNQLLLPHIIEYVQIETIEQAHDAIKSMKIRGAPAIGSLASLSIASTLSSAVKATPRPDFLASPASLEAYIAPKLEYLFTARPTAVNLGAAMRRLAKVLSQAVTAHQQQSEPRVSDTDAAVAIANDIIAEAKLIGGEDKAQNITMSKLGGDWLHKRVGGSRKYLNVLTVCNTGSLATSGYGTALGFITYLHEQGLLERAYYTQTAPYHQGSRLTSLELHTLSIPSTMICDTMVGSLFQHKSMHAVVVGADRIARNGDTANKIGTYNAAVLAARHKIAFIVVAPTSSVDLSIADGSGIPIEHRPPLEACLVRGALHPPSYDAAGHKVQAQVLITPGAVGETEGGVYNPSFDVTPAELITAIVTEKYVAVKREGEASFELLREAEEAE